jgi:hypothetical protein
MDASLKIISGGQVGVDRAALDAAIELGLPVGGWCLRGRLCEDGTVPEQYPLWETRSSELHVRTQRNVESSTATLVMTRGTPTGGTRYAVEIASSMRRPLLVLDLTRPDGDPVELVVSWLRDVQPRVLNVCGPREAGAPGIASESRRILADALRIAGYAS